MEASLLARVPFAANPAWYGRIAAALRGVYWVGDVARSRFLYVSPGFEEVWGVPVEALYADAAAWMAALHPDDRRHTVEAMYGSDEGEVEYRIVRADGTLRWIHTRFFTTHDEATGVPSVVGVSSDITGWHVLQQQLTRQEGVLRGVAQATHALLTTPDFEAAVTRALDLLGAATGVDRVYLFENHRCPETGAHLTSQRFEWARGSVAPQIDNPELQGVPYAAFCPRWETVLGAGEAVCGLVRDFPEGERAMLEPQGIVSILVVPVTVGGAFWGFVGFDDCTAERTWSEGERSILTVAASSLGAAFARERGGEALRESEARHRLLAETATDVIVTVDADNVIHYANPAAAQVLGYAPEELVGADLMTLIPERFHDVHRAGVAHFVAVEERLGLRYVEVPLRRKDGEEIPTAISFGAYRQDGRLLFTAFLRDVSEQKAAEQALRESEGQYRHLVDTIREVVFQTDAEGRWTFLNPAWTEITGFAVDESLGRPFLDYVHPDDRALNAEKFAPLINREKEECRHTVRYVTRDGGSRYIEVTARLVLDADGRTVGTAGTLADVTEQRQAMRALEATLDRERELGELKTRFVSMASHELRTPLAAIQSSAELVGRFVARGDTARVDKYVARIQANVSGMTELLEDVLLMGKAEEGQLTFDPQPLEIGAAIEEIVEQVRMGVGARHRFTVALPGDPVPALADRKLLHLALSNLLSNAAKYAEAGTRIEVELGLSAGADAFAITVRDHGIGIPSADLPHLFQAFHRASNVGTRRGTGLGLAIVQRAADLHGGRVGVASVPGEGSTFTLTLPLRRP